VYAVALGGSDGRTLFLAVSPSHFKHERAHTRDSVLLSRRVGVPLGRTCPGAEAPASSTVPTAAHSGGPDSGAP
jgi:hypothetical protein